MNTHQALTPQVVVDQVTSWVITHAYLDEEANDESGSLILTFENGYSLHVTDFGQACCEHRFMDTDDDLTVLEGGRLLTIRTNDIQEKDDENSDIVHDIGFLIIQSTRGAVTVATHNRHNGYYGGFSLYLELKDPSGDLVVRKERIEYDEK